MIVMHMNGQARFTDPELDRAYQRAWKAIKASGCQIRLD